MNARNIIWGETRSNSTGAIQEQYVKENVETLNHGQQTFYAVNGSSIIDLILTADGIRGWKRTLSIDTDAELLTGYTQITGQSRPNFCNI